MVTGARFGITIRTPALVEGRLRRLRPPLLTATRPVVSGWGSTRGTPRYSVTERARFSAMAGRLAVIHMASSGLSW